MSRRCQITGKTNNVANNVSHSKRHTKRVQQANIVSKRLFIPSAKRWVRLRLSTSALRSIDRMGVEAFLKKHGYSI
ncbi:50S ribosomal protein L28 [Candidatus Sumerlaeota bacterium]|nr:50S ribosomal protein L28 [Candidatus Sumerlaeota bacterium]